MKGWLILIAALALGCSSAAAEGVAERALREADLNPIVEFAAEHGADVDVRGLSEGALRGETPGVEAVLDGLKRRVAAPVQEVLRLSRGLAAPALLMAIMRAVLPGRTGGSGGACFLLRLTLVMGFSEIASAALVAAEDCLKTAGAFSEAAAPAIAALLTAMGMTGTAALVSPAAAIAGDLAEELFLKWGLPLCRCALCTAIAGNLSETIDLSRVTQLLRRTANWGAGLATTLFTALIALQGGVAGAVDGVAARTAKYAVDSAAPVIGSGVSDAWESYVAGMRIAKNAVGVSGIAALIGAGLRPVLICAAGMLTLNLIAALMDALGEKEAARAAGQAGGICQMALSLSTGALAIATVLLGAAMAAGGNLAG